MFKVLQQIFKFNNTPVPIVELLLPTAFKELGSASEELQIASEELLQQNHQLLDMRATLEAERQRYWDLFDSAPDAYLVTDSKSTIQEANRAACKLLNLSSKYLVGKPLSVFVTEAERHNFRCQLNKLYQHDKEQEWIIPNPG